ncbi:hypothetical protein LTR66_006387, partial [Elasticomyces elasticus]
LAETLRYLVELRKGNRAVREWLRELGVVVPEAREEDEDADADVSVGVDVDVDAAAEDDERDIGGGEIVA